LQNANQVTSWLTFTWEVLRNVLDLLRNNPGLETAYHGTAHRALNFCKTHERKNEFKKLCTNLKLHFMDAQKYRDKDGPMSPETLELHLATRFEQLKAATALHQWTEGFAIIGDIHMILDTSSKKPPAQLMATYYQKLTQLFLMSGNFLFHAYACRAYYDLSREKNKSVTKEQVRGMANQVVLAALSIPLPSASSGLNLGQISVQKEKDRRLASLLGFDVNPDRASLLEDLRSNTSGTAKILLEDCSSQVKELYEALETEKTFDPLSLVSRVAPIIAMLRADPKTEAFAKPLDELVVIKLCRQLARAYSRLKLKQFHSMCAHLGLSSLEAERILVKAIRNRQLHSDGAMDVRCVERTKTKEAD
jgi:translation initiation factor 3 subunit A